MSKPVTAQTVGRDVGEYVARVLDQIGPDEFMFDVAIWAIDHDETARLHFYDGFGREHDAEAEAAKVA